MSNTVPQRTLAIIKPDAVAKGVVGEIITRIERAGFSIRAARFLRLSAAEAGGFYIVHQERPFYGSLCAFMTQGPVLVMVLEAEDAITRWRDLMGATDPSGTRTPHLAAAKAICGPALFSTIPTTSCATWSSSVPSSSAMASRC